MVVNTEETSGIRKVVKERSGSVEYKKRYIRNMLCKTRTQIKMGSIIHPLRENDKDMVTQLDDMFLRPVLLG